MSDNKIRSEYIKILKTVPSRGGQDAPSWVIDEAKTANIKTIKRKVDAFRRRESKLKKTQDTPFLVLLRSGAQQPSKKILGTRYSF